MAEALFHGLTILGFETKKHFNKQHQPSLASDLNSINLSQMGSQITQTQMFILQTFSKRIVGPSNGFPCSSIEDVPKEIKHQFKDLKEVAEGDAKPERETTSQGVEQTPILWQIDFILHFIPLTSML